jgi:hypothetical protein
VMEVHVWVSVREYSDAEYHGTQEEVCDRHECDRLDPVGSGLARPDPPGQVREPSPHENRALLLEPEANAQNGNGGRPPAPSALHLEHVQP